MKRFVTFAAVAALAVIALSSCGQKENPDKKAQFGYATVTTKYYINDDLDKVADVTLNITKFDGTKMSVPVSTTQQVVDMEKYKGAIPADFTFNFTATQKDNLTKDSYNCKLTYEMVVKVYDTNGNLKKSKTDRDEVEVGNKKENIDLTIARFNRIGTKFVINEDMTIDTEAVR